MDRNNPNSKITALLSLMIFLDLIPNPPVGIQLNSPSTKLNALMAMINLLSLSLRDIFFHVFTTPHLRSKCGPFLGYQSGADIPFAPAYLFDTWYESFPQCRSHLFGLVSKYARKIVIMESNAAIHSKELRIKPAHCTTEQINSIAAPDVLLPLIRSLMPMSFDWLVALMAEPNDYRRSGRYMRRAAQKDRNDDDSEEELDREGEDGDGPEVYSWNDKYPGMRRNPEMVRSATFSDHVDVSLLVLHS